MIALIDSDSICYAAAAVTEGQGEGLAKWQANAMIEETLRSLNTTEFKLYLTGDNNFRYALYPEYKAQRLKVPRPEYLQAVKDHLVTEWNAFVSPKGEADDWLGIDLTTYNEMGVEAILSHIDKDLNMIPGLHYIPELKREGKIIREARRFVVSPLDAIRFFYTQLLVGDSADNIKGAIGIGKIKAEKVLDGLTEEADMLAAVRDYFSCDEELEMNARVLWIARKEIDEWRLPTSDEGMD